MHTNSKANIWFGWPTDSLPTHPFTHPLLDQIKRYDVHLARQFTRAAFVSRSGRFLPRIWEKVEKKTQPEVWKARGVRPAFSSSCPALVSLIIVYLIVLLEFSATLMITLYHPWYLHIEQDESRTWTFAAEKFRRQRTTMRCVPMAWGLPELDARGSCRKCHQIFGLRYIRRWQCCNCKCST